MVDVSNIGSVPGAGKLPEKAPAEERPKNEDAPVVRRKPADKVEISKEALSRQEAEKAAAEARRLLEESDKGIGADEDRLREL